MTLWHKPTETAKGHGLVVVKKGKSIGILTAYEHRSQAPASRWCYLTELLKLEQENKKSQKKLEVAVETLEDIGYCKSRIMLNYPERLVHWALDALAKIKGNK